MNFLQDLLEQCLAEPQCAPLWHSLFQVWDQTIDQVERLKIVERLAALEMADPRADVLRLTFLSRATGDRRFAGAAASRTLDVKPFNPDRVAAIAAFYSILPLGTQSGRDTFAAALTEARLPDLVNRLGLEAEALLPAGLSRRPPADVRKIAVVSPHLGNRFHTPSTLAMNQCELLVRAGRSVEWYSCQEQLVLGMALFHGGSINLDLAQPDGPAWTRLQPAGVTMKISDSRFSLRLRWREMLGEIAKFDPDLVLFVGMYSPLAAALYKVRPVVGLCSNGVPPMSPVDVWLCSEEAMAGRRLPVWEGRFPPPLAHFHPHRVKSLKGPFELTRAQLGLPEDALVWVTAGFRLETEIGGPWAARMAKALTEHAGAVWLLVGGNGKVPKALQQLPQGKVHALATRPDFAAVLSLCDIFVNPPRMGGGFSVAEAMAANLPVLAFAGSDGGDKVGEWALADIDAYMERLAALVADPALRAQMGQALRERFAARFDFYASGPNLIGACELAVRNSADRLRAGSS
jgi:glycosyltransferase involved in cell wall biosynthesis